MYRSSPYHLTQILKYGQNYIHEKIYKDYPFDGKLLDIRQLSEFGQAFDAVRLDTMSEEELTLAKVHYYGLFC